MSPKPPKFVIGGEGFPTKRGVEEHVKDILKKTLGVRDPAKLLEQGTGRQK